MRNHSADVQEVPELSNEVTPLFLCLNQTDSREDVIEIAFDKRYKRVRLVKYELPFRFVHVSVDNPNVIIPKELLDKQASVLHFGIDRPKVAEALKDVLSFKRNDVHQNEQGEQVVSVIGVLYKFHLISSTFRDLDYWYARQCQYCYAESACLDELFLQCPRCERAWFCSLECQTNAWTEYHRHVCLTLKELRENQELGNLFSDLDL